MIYNDAAKEAKKTLTIIEKGEYVASSGEIVDVSEAIRDAVVNTCILSPGQLGYLKANLDEWSTPEVYDMTVEVRNETAQEALQRVHWEGARHPLVLNFASAKRPGGGFLRDSRAQEEDLCRSSALFECLRHQHPFYGLYHLTPTPMNTDYLIHSLKVPFWKLGDLMPDKPVLADVITAAAPNLNGIPVTPKLLDEAEKAMFRRISNVLTAAAQVGADELVLGAWGCGVFHNDPETVAKLFAHHLRSDRFNDVFKRVVFAVWDKDEDTPTYNTFREHLHWTDEEEE